MGDGTDFPRVELEAKQKIVFAALQVQRTKERKHREALLKKSEQEDNFCAAPLNEQLRT